MQKFTAKNNRILIERKHIPWQRSQALALTKHKHLHSDKFKTNN